MGKIVLRLFYSCDACGGMHMQNIKYDIDMLSAIGADIAIFDTSDRRELCTKCGEQLRLCRTVLGKEIANE